jgi:putative intracellular protease/amidase
MANANEEMEVIMTIDALRRAKADVAVASAEDTLEVAARYGMRIVTDVSLDDAAEQQFDPHRRAGKSRITAAETSLCCACQLTVCSNA